MFDVSTDLEHFVDICLIKIRCFLYIFPLLLFRCSKAFSGVIFIY
ncbi:hypothetical protein HMPREF9446_02252 [Bacteroides fluxus YIT 12057]|uniref:Uncharacterized protein n=1 Tax=Bacteroides fluxus YIT 12057 TaxID=763034 RepID=F3PU32_9BACE|nr:hypothetical protein HMPREF9446_02252 [Bacteroides fluxus YIT 12057]